MQSLWTSLSGMQSSLTWLDRIGNNLANESTPGYAAETGTFSDMFTQALSGNATGPTVAGRYTPQGLWNGTGVLASGVESNFSQMPIQRTGDPLDLALQGAGFFMVRGPQGQAMLTKAGNFQWSKAADGRFMLATQSGLPVLDVKGQPIMEESGAKSSGLPMSVGMDGQISYGHVNAQRIAIAEVNLPSQSLSDAGDNLFSVQAGAGLTVANAPGSPSAGQNSSVVQGGLSMSNVDATVEMTDMVQAQHMFSLNAEALQLTNRMLQVANSIKA